MTFDLIFVSLLLAGWLICAYLPWVVASIVTRGIRFFMVAAVLKFYGPTILPIVERRLYLTTAIVVGVFPLTTAYKA